MRTGNQNRSLTPLQIYWKNILYLYDINYLNLSTLVSIELSNSLNHELSWVSCIKGNSHTPNATDSIKLAPKFLEFLELIRRINRKSKMGACKSKQKKPDYFEYKQLLALRELHSEMEKRNIQSFSRSDLIHIETFLDTVGLYQEEGDDGEPIINSQCFNRNIMKSGTPKNTTIDLVGEAFMLVISKRKPIIHRKQVSLADVIKEYGWKKFVFTELESDIKHGYEFGFNEDRKKLRRNSRK